MAGFLYFGVEIATCFKCSLYFGVEKAMWGKMGKMRNMGKMGNMGNMGKMGKMRNMGKIGKMGNMYLIRSPATSRRLLASARKGGSAAPWASPRRAERPVRGTGRKRSATMRRNSSRGSWPKTASVMSSEV